MTLPSPPECPWSKVCLIDTQRGPVAVYVERDQYGDYPYLAGDGVYLAKHDLPPVDPYAVVADLPSILPAPKLVAAHLNPAPAAYAGSWVSPSFGGGSWGGSYGGDTIISGSSSTTIIRKIIREGDTIIIKYPDPWEPCGCIEPPIPPVAPVPLDASAGFLLIGLAVLAMVRGRA